MRGEVLHYDEAQGFGFITGADGNRYTFTRENLRRETAMPKGTGGRIPAGSGQARDIFSIRAQAASPAADAGGKRRPASSQPRTLRPAQHRRSISAALAETARPTDLWGYFWRRRDANYINFAERARRKEYWSYCLFWTVCLLIIVASASSPTSKWAISTAPRGPR